jgi:hypothetical protein
MSHNLESVSNNTQTRASELNFSLEDLNDCSTSPVSGQILKYSGTEWAGGVGQQISRVPITAWVDSSGWSTSIYNYGTNDNVIWRNNQINFEDTTYVAHVTASGALVPVTTPAWTQYWTLKSSGLNGKTIRCEASHRARYLSGSEYIHYQWGVGSSNLATFTPIGNIAEQNANYTQTAYGVYTVGSSDINLALKVVAVSGSISIMTGAEALPNYFTISILK